MLLKKDLLIILDFVNQLKDDFSISDVEFNPKDDGLEACFEFDFKKLSDLKYTIDLFLEEHAKIIASYYLKVDSLCTCCKMCVLFNR